MFGIEQKTQHHAVSYDTFTINTPLGDIKGHQFTMTDVFNSDNNVLYLLDFPNKHCVLKSAINNGKIIGNLDHPTFSGKGLMYVGVDKNFIFHSSFLYQTLESAVLSYSKGITPGSSLINMMIEYPYNMRNFLASHLKGRLQGFGYNKDLRQWDLINKIENQNAIGDIVNYRVTKVKDAMIIINKLNEKFPMGKKGL